MCFFTMFIVGAKQQLLACFILFFFSNKSGVKIKVSQVALLVNQEYKNSGRFVTPYFSKLIQLHLKGTGAPWPTEFTWALAVYIQVILKNLAREQPPSPLENTTSFMIRDL